MQTQYGNLIMQCHTVLLNLPFIHHQIQQRDIIDTAFILEIWMGIFTVMRSIQLCFAAQSFSYSIRHKQEKTKRKQGKRKESKQSVVLENNRPRVDRILATSCYKEIYTSHQEHCFPTDTSSPAWTCIWMLQQTRYVQR